MEGICKQYAPEGDVQVGRSKSYTGSLIQAEGVTDLIQHATEKFGAVLVGAIDWSRERDGDDLTPGLVEA